MSAPFILSSCDTGQTPFSLNVFEFNEIPPQQPAAITVSDPQIYARETLINDRLRERKFLEGLLAESEKIEFRDEISKPALIRDLETLEAFRAAVDVDFDPAKGRAKRREERLAGLDNQIEATDKERQLVEKQTELVLAKKKLENARKTSDEVAGTTSGNPAPVADTGEDTASGQTQPAAQPPTENPAQENAAREDTAKKGEQASQGGSAAPRANQILSELKGRISDLEKRLDRVAGRFGKRAMTVSIPDAERSRDAYRAELRNRLNAVNLDDLHDYNGNSLYRLQFRVTVMPGEHKDKFGVARLTVLPPRLSEDDLNALYRTWILHLAHRLNFPFPSVRRACPKAVGSILRLNWSGLVYVRAIRYRVVDEMLDKATFKGLNKETFWGLNSTSVDQLPKTVEQKDTDCTLYIPLPPSNGASPLLDNPDALPILEVIASINKDHRPTRDAARRAVELITQKPAAGAPTLKVPDKFKKLLGETIVEVSGAPTGNETKFTDFTVSKDPAMDRHPDGQTGKSVLRARGSAYAYATAPLEKSQRLSTNAQAARSLEMALSLAASLATKGLSAGLDLGFVRESAGIAEAFESQPIVVGFAERRSRVERETQGAVDPVYLTRHQAPQVGWVFGPKVRMNPEKNELKLIHSFAAHEVSADLSLPGWWPRIDVILETAWIGNLHNSGRPIRLEDESGQGFHRERFSVELPLNAADLDGLTEFIARQVVGTSLPIIAIQHVEPFFISACSRKVKLLVKGANVWRSTRVFLGGIEAEDISILPDMEGVAATFDLDTMFETKNRALTDLGLEQGIRLTVWTRNGSDSLSLRLLGNRVGGERGSCVARTTVSPATAFPRFEIVDVSPAQICASWKEVTFLVKGFSPRTKHNTGGKVTAIFGNSVIKDVMPDTPATGSSRVYELTFAGGPFGAGGRNIPLTVTNGEDLSSVPIRLVSCKTPPPPPAKAATIVGTNTIAKVESKEYRFMVTGLSRI